MKKLVRFFFDTGKHSASMSLSLLFLRIAVGLLMLTHGYGKLMMLVAEGHIQFADPIGMGVTSSLILVVFAEFFCSIFLILGVGTRFSVIPLLVTMLVAAFIIHANDPLNVKELALFYATIYIFLFTTGAGRFSLDTWIQKKIK